MLAARLGIGASTRQPDSETRPPSAGVAPKTLTQVIQSQVPDTNRGNAPSGFPLAMDPWRVDEEAALHGNGPDPDGSAGTTQADDEDPGLAEFLRALGGDSQPVSAPAPEATGQPNANTVVREYQPPVFFEPGHGGMAPESSGTVPARAEILPLRRGPEQSPSLDDFDDIRAPLPEPASSWQPPADQTPVPPFIAPAASIQYPRNEPPPRTVESPHPAASPDSWSAGGPAPSPFPDLPAASFDGPIFEEASALRRDPDIDMGAPESETETSNRVAHETFPTPPEPSLGDLSRHIEEVPEGSHAAAEMRPETDRGSESGPSASSALPSPAESIAEIGGIDEHALVHPPGGTSSEATATSEPEAVSIVAPATLQHDVQRSISDTATIARANRAEPGVVKSLGSSGMPLMAVWDAEPIRLDKEGLFQLLKWAVTNHVSDLFLQSGFPIIGERYKTLTRLTQRSLTSNELMELYGTFSTSGPSRLIGGIPDDFRIDFKGERGVTFQFRVCITSVKSAAIGERGLEWVIRPIPSNIPNLEDLQLPQVMLDHIFPSTGMVLVTGPTGSGKSTLLASINKRNVASGRRVVSYEAPIEFDLVSLSDQAGFAAQSELGIDLGGTWNGFEHAISNALRRKPHVIFVGEMRDRGSIAGAITGAQSGHAVYSTTHTNSTVGTVGRLTDQFEPRDRASIESNLIYALRCVVHQRLVPSLDGKVTPLLEVLPFDDDLRRKLIFDDGSNRRKIMYDYLDECGLSLEEHARYKFERGMISEYEYRKIRHETGARHE